MSLDFDYLMGLAPMETIHDVGRRDTILYALGVGLAAYGIVGRALVKALCEDRPERLQRMDVRFSTPAYPGEAFEIDIWRDGRGTAAFRVRLAERGLMAQQNGYAQFDA